MEQNNTGRTCGSGRCIVNRGEWDAPLRKRRPETRGNRWAPAAVRSSHWRAGGLEQEGQARVRSTGR